ncbi:MAG: hypothetical protein QOD32_2126 [Pyrinomonadaceae bacterium]|jgi:hypothetical protein|nr:hypothetical protein [Pyrinomonadaceae bacterium]
MKCTRVEKFLPLHVAGDLTGRRRARAVERHLAACDRCRHAADGYRASRELLRAATLPDEFDEAFYEEIRSNVLARIKHDRRPWLAPTAPLRLPSFFGARYAYAASLALLCVAAALALHSYTRRTSDDDIRQRMIATVNDERPTPTAALVKTPTAIKTPQATRPDGDDQTTLMHPLKEFARGTVNNGKRAGKSSLPKSDTKVEHARNGSSPGLHTTRRAPSTAVRNPLATMVAAATAQANAEASAATGASGSSEQTTAAPEVSRIEIQTSDPNIRIIWLTPSVEDTARPLK